MFFTNNVCNFLIIILSLIMCGFYCNYTTSPYSSYMIRLNYSKAHFINAKFIMTLDLSFVQEEKLIIKGETNMSYSNKKKASNSRRTNMRYSKPMLKSLSNGLDVSSCFCVSGVDHTDGHTYQPKHSVRPLISCPSMSSSCSSVSMFFLFFLFIFFAKTWQFGYSYIL